MDDDLIFTKEELADLVIVDQAFAEIEQQIMLSEAVLKKTHWVKRLFLAIFSSIFFHSALVILFLIIIYFSVDKKDPAAQDYLILTQTPPNPSIAKDEKVGVLPEKVYDQSIIEKELPDIISKIDSQPTNDKVPADEAQKLPEQKNNQAKDSNEASKSDLALESEKRLEGIGSKDDGKLGYSLDVYSWSFETYAEQWAKKIINWWGTPGDYAAGKYPNGGGLWVAAKINKAGQLLGFEVIKSEVSAEMEEKAVKALISSFEIPKLPNDFPGEVTFYWHFIYPKIDLSSSLKRKQ